MAVKRERYAFVGGASCSLGADCDGIAREEAEEPPEKNEEGAQEEPILVEHIRYGNGACAETNDHKAES